MAQGMTFLVLIEISQQLLDGLLRRHDDETKYLQNIPTSLGCTLSLGATYVLKDGESDHIPAKHRQVSIVSHANSPNQELVPSTAVCKK